MSSSLADVFADTTYWIALVVKQDQYHPRAQAWTNGIKPMGWREEEVRGLRSELRHGPRHAPRAGCPGGVDLDRRRDCCAGA